MVGYLMSGSRGAAVERISAFLLRHWSEADWLQKAGFTTLPAVWQSHHSRPAEKPIEVMHQFLAFP